MPYAAEQQLRDRLGADLTALLADEDGDGAADAPILTAALDDASAEIDAFLAGRYVVPLPDPAPPAVMRLAVDLAVYFLFIRRREAVAPEHLENWKRARRFLADVAEGRRALEGPAPRLAGFATESTVRGQDRRFDRDSLEEF